jgi:hypothetical protein
MKGVMLGFVLGAVIATLAVAGSCSIDHRSDEYACVSQSQCSSGRLCMGGFCIVPGAIDAPRAGDGPHGTGADGSGSNDCPDQCSTCNVAQHTCTIDCETSSCTGTVTCPTGYNCDIKCDTQNSCRNGVTCDATQPCTVECSGSGACRTVTCGDGPCDVTCSGAQSCHGVTCGSSCSCTVLCTGLQSCPQGDVDCTSIGCDDGSGCTATPPFCHSC